MPLPIDHLRTHSQIAVFPRNDALAVTASQVPLQIAPLLPPSRAPSSFGLAPALDSTYGYLLGEERRWDAFPQEVGCSTQAIMT